MSNWRPYGSMLVLGLIAIPLEAQRWSSGRPDGHAPIGVMQDHTHSGGEVMLSYRLMRMEMDGNRVGTESVTDDDVLADYMITPTRMPMTMHMLGVMFAPTDRLTLMGMIPFVTSEMDHRTRPGGEFTTESSAIGDVRVTGLVQLFNRNRQTVHLNLGVSAPTGSIEETDVTPASAPNEVVLPYPMQIGSGTWDLIGGATYLGQTARTSWGAQAIGTVRLGENDRDWRRGHHGLATTWGAWRFNHWFSGSARLELSAWGDVDGADPSLDPNMVPTADPELRGGQRADVGIGLNLDVPRGALDGQRLAVEVLFPVWQDLDGPQLENDWMVIAGWQYAFQLIGTHH